MDNFDLNIKPHYTIDDKDMTESVMENLNEFYSQTWEDELSRPVNDIFSNNEMTPAYTAETLLTDMDKLDDNELLNIVASSYETIFADVIYLQTGTYLELITNPRFLKALIKILDNATYITDNVRFCSTKVAYDYFSFKKGGVDKELESLMITLIRTVNRDKIKSLSTIPIDETIITKMCLCAYGTDNVYTALKRINRLIIETSSTIMTAQHIMWIYELLFSKLSILVEGIMLDKFVDVHLLNKDQRIVYMNMSTALLDIMQNQSMIVLLSVLRAYGECFVVNQYTDAKFSFKAIDPSRYGRVLEAVRLVENEGYYIP